jgi:hypothetical protein
MQIIQFRSVDRRALEPQGAEKLKRHSSWIRPKLSMLLAPLAYMRRLIPDLDVSSRQMRSAGLGASRRIGYEDCSPARKRWMMSEAFGSAVGEKMSSGGPMEERIIWSRRFQAHTFDLRGQVVLTRFDCCEFVKCTVLIDQGTEQLAFTACAFKDCNIDHLEPDERRGLYGRDNVFHRPLEERRADFEHRLAKTLARRSTLPRYESFSSG